MAVANTEIIEDGAMVGVGERKDVQETNVIDLWISQALEKNLPIDTLERFFAMRKELLAEQAKRAYFNAMAVLQSRLEIVPKTKPVKNKSGIVVYHYAPIEGIIEVLNPLLNESGISYSFQTEMIGGSVKVTCTATHALGHSESSLMQSELATRTEIMSAPQQVAATITFLKRHTLMNVFGIGTGDEDIDGAEEKKVEVATQEQKDKIDQLAIQAGIDKAYVATRCRDIYGVSFTMMSKVQADGIISMLEKRIKEKV